MLVALIPADTNKPVALFDITPHLEWMQTVVGGYVERIGLQNCDLYVAEEGKLKGQPVNPVASLLAELGSDNVVGTVIVTGKPEDGEITTLSLDGVADLMGALAGVAEIKRVMAESIVRDGLAKVAERLNVSGPVATGPDVAPDEPQEGDIVIEVAPDGGLMMTPLDRKVYAWTEVWEAVMAETVNSGRWPNVWLINTDSGTFEYLPTGYGTNTKEEVPE